MRAIQVFNRPVVSITVSPDGRFLGVIGRPGDVDDDLGGYKIALVEQLTGEIIHCLSVGAHIQQVAFTPDGQSMVFAHVMGLYRLETTSQHEPVRLTDQRYVGCMAISPDGRTLVVGRTGPRQQAPLDRWELPAWRRATGFDYWSPFVRLAFSPNGEFLAGIDAYAFELRIAVTGGLNSRQRILDPGWVFLAFARDSQSVVYGGGRNLYVMETRGGAVTQRIPSPGKPFADAAFLGSGRLLATVDHSSILRLWSVETWTVVREYDWDAGGLTCLSASTDGLAGVCGTDTGRVVVFDVDD